MNIGYIPKLSMIKPIFPTQPTAPTAALSKLQMEADVSKPNFQQVLGNTIQQVNEVTQAPDALMHQAMTTGGVDVHDVMVANAKAELLINVTTQTATKVVQAYDRILQIQI